MKERPILFSTPMVQAILSGRKTMTRRVVKFPVKSKTHHISIGECDNPPPKEWCPYGQIGDRLWVRETFRPSIGMPTGYRYEYKATALEDGVPVDEPWKPSIFMPREASRILLEITDERVERLQDISEEDAKAEGIEKKHFVGSIHFAYKLYGVKNHYDENPKNSFWSLWESINGPESWKSNPWVWVIEFKVINK